MHSEAQIDALAEAGISQVSDSSGSHSHSGPGLQDWPESYLRVCNM